MIDTTLAPALQAQILIANAQLANITPNPPASSDYKVIMDNLEESAGWIQPGNVGNSGGGSPVPHGTYEMTLGTMLSPATITIQPAYPYDNFYFYRGLGTFNTATHFRLALQFQLPTEADIVACQAFEFEMQQSTGALVFNMAYQFNQAGTKTLRIFNYATKVWADTGIPFTLIPGQWTTVVAEFARTASVMYHVGITVNGVWHSVLVPHNGVAVSGIGYLNAAFQLDTTGGNEPPSYKCLLQNYDVSWS